MDTVLESANRLLADVPLEELQPGAIKTTLRLLVVDHGEEMSEREVTSLRHLLTGLQGTALRVVVLVKNNSAELSHLPLAGLGGRAVLCHLESCTVGLVRLDKAIRADMSKELLPAPVAHELTPTHEGVSVTVSDEPDVMDDLTRERSGMSAIQNIVQPRMAALSIAVLSIMVVMLIALSVTTWVASDDATDAIVVYTCRTQPDLESVQTLVDRLGKGIPTRVSEQVGRYRLEVGPFNGQASAYAVRSQVWRLGACHANPVTISTKPNNPQGLGE